MKLYSLKRLLPIVAVAALTQQNLAAQTSSDTTRTQNRPS